MMPYSCDTADSRLATRDSRLATLRQEILAGVLPLFFSTACHDREHVQRLGAGLGALCAFPDPCPMRGQVYTGGLQGEDRRSALV